MKLLRSVADMQAFSLVKKREGKSLGLVPTMGFFHEGHLSLMRAARKACDEVVVSLFVNPTQFGPDEDFAKYPRDARRDAELAEGEGVDVLFNPKAEDIYPKSYFTYVNVEKLSEPLCGKSRPGHFRGVATVVAKLFNIILPDKAFFGFKDAQQSVVIRAMARDLNFPVEITVCPTVREADGLAMSSRNKYLSSEERKSALTLYQALCRARDAFVRGERSTKTLKADMWNTIKAVPFTKVEYIELSHPETLEPVKKLGEKTLASLAVLVGKTRLIDNMIIPER